MLVESVYFPALAAMLFESCATNAGLKAVLLKQAAAYAKSLRPLELYGETSCHESVERVVEVLFIVYHVISIYTSKSSISITQILDFECPLYFFIG